MDTGLGNRLTVTAERGRRTTFSRMTHTKLSVYEPERLGPAKGDTIRMTGNDAGLDLSHGDRFKRPTLHSHPLAACL